MNAQRFKTRRGLLALMASAALIATATITSQLAVGNTISPAGCEDNGITLSIGRTPAVAQPGQTITYTVNVTNGVTASADKPCDVTGATVTIDLPNPATGQPSGSPEILVSNHDFPANGSGNIGPISRTFTVPAGPLTYGTATAQAGLSNALLHDSDFNDDFADTTKSVSAAIADANISITPSATNQVGTNHIFTAHVNTMVGNGVYGNAPANTPITFTIVSDSATSLPNPPTGCLTVGTTGSCTTTISSATTGVTVVAAHTSVIVGGLTIVRHTDGTGGSSGPATKTWVDARITIQQTGTNQVGTAHTFTVTTTADPGTGTFVATPGTITGTSTSFGTITGGTCTLAGAMTPCSIIVNSNATGVALVNATATVTVGGVPIAVSTTGHGAFNISNQKTWVDARITIQQTGTNEVGTAHTFTVTTTADNGSGTFVATPGTITARSISGLAGATITGGTCTVGASTPCTIIVNSTATGTATVNAEADVVVGGVTVHVSSTGHGAFNISNQKTWVDANIQINPPTANNPVGTNHTLTGHVNVNAGGGFVNAPVGTLITFSITNSGGANATFVGGNTCTTIGVTGSCTVVISSSTSGTTTVKATTTVNVGGVSLVRTTGDGKLGDSADANKTWSDDTVRTHVHDAAHADITGTTVAGGSVVHDNATVTRTANTPAGVPDPTGSVTFTLYDNGTCNGAVLMTEPNVPLGTESSTFTTPANGIFSYLAHYNGDANYPARNASCEPFSSATQTGKGVDFTGSMEGALKWQPTSLGTFGTLPTWINAGYHFHVDTKQPAFVETVTSRLMIPVHCDSAHGPYAGVPITFKGNALDKNGVPFQGIIVDMGTLNFNVPANSTQWIRTGDQNSPLVWMTAIGSPDLCGGGTMYNSEGADFQATFSIPPVGHIFEQFHYRIPAAKGKPNTNCTDLTDPNRAKADVCGASWSSTQDP